MSEFRDFLFFTFIFFLTFRTGSYILKLPYFLQLYILV